MYRPFEEFRPAGRLISVIGSGGKTTFLRYLADRLPGSVILTTSTHIFPYPDIPLVEACGDRVGILRELRAALSHSRIVCLGRPEPSGKLADPSPFLPFEDLLPEADSILVEADGAAGRPLKAHRPWEPVIPDCSDLTVCMVGASGIGKTVSEACHCPELFSMLAGISVDETTREEHIAAVLNRESLGDCYLVNQADTVQDPECLRLLCSLVSKSAYPCCLAQP